MQERNAATRDSATGGCDGRTTRQWRLRTQHLAPLLVAKADGHAATAAESLRHKHPSRNHRCRQQGTMLRVHAPGVRRRHAQQAIQIDLGNVGHIRPPTKALSFDAASERHEGTGLDMSHDAAAVRGDPDSGPAHTGLRRQAAEVERAHHQKRRAAEAQAPSVHDAALQSGHPARWTHTNHPSARCRSQRARERGGGLADMAGMGTSAHAKHARRERKREESTRG